MPVRIRLSRGGAKKRPFYRIVVADSRRSRDGKFIDQLGTYNPMLAKDNPERVKINADKAKDWIVKGAQPSDRVKLFLSNIGIVEKPIITEKTKKHLPKKKAEATAEVKSDTPAEADKEVKEATSLLGQEINSVLSNLSADHPLYNKITNRFRIKNINSIYIEIENKIK